MRPPNLRELKEMIGQAMKDKAPAMYAELSSKGLLDGVLTDRAEQAQESAWEAVSEPRWKILTNPSDDIREQVVRLEQVKAKAWQVAISQATEFPPETIEPNPTPEALSPKVRRSPPPNVTSTSSSWSSASTPRTRARPPKNSA
jgi:hypothetical protein